MAVRLSALRAGRPLPSGRFLVLISVRGWADPRAIVRVEGLGQLNNPMTSSGIEPATFRLVAQYTVQRRATRHVLTRVPKCIDVDGGIFENVLYYVNCTKFITWKRNTGIKNNTLYLFLTNYLGTVQWNSSISETVRNTKHVHIYSFLLRITNTMTSHNIHLPPGTSYTCNTKN
jgi:hypothetical protein